MKIVKIQDTGTLHIPKEFRAQLGKVEYVEISMSGSTMICEPVGR